MQPEYSFSVKVAMLEIYNEEVRDLLSSNGTSGGGNNAAGHDVWEGGGGGVGKLEIRRDQDGAVQVRRFGRGSGNRSYRSSCWFVGGIVCQTGILLY